MNSGIYKIENQVNNKVYIGSSVELNKRKRNHFNSLKGDYHYNNHLQNAWNKYGEDNFIFKIIVECGKPRLVEYEQYWIDRFKSYKRRNGYNLRKKADQSSVRKEIRKKIRGTLTGRERPDKVIEKFSKSLKETWENKDYEDYPEFCKKDIRGEDHPTSELEKEEVELIKSLLKTDVFDYKKIAEQMDVSEDCIMAIKNGHNWSHIN